MNNMTIPIDEKEVEIDFSFMFEREFNFPTFLELWVDIEKCGVSKLVSMRLAHFLTDKVEQARLLEATHAIMNWENEGGTHARHDTA